ncbi:phage head closure protein [Arvimicrobium flavum]|uniref:phage head closure protein n=1 Tax=Arvimicrobium flavum TaxID=3393320 RepID=UPI00237AA219|nr:phage head closure protein [Mesorhizobium shangrilense]
MRMAFLDPGLLRTELVLEEATLAPDGQGGHTESWSEAATVFALVEPVSATSVFGADQTLETVTHRITLRARDGLASGMRFRKCGRVFAILTGHDPDESGRYLVCRTREVGL